MPPHFPGQSASAEKVGRIILNFLDAGSILYVIELDAGGYEFGFLERFAFGHARYVDQHEYRLDFDLRGEWLFVDMHNRKHAPLRFNFSEQEPANPPLQWGTGATYSITYSDPERDARLVCASQPEGDSGDPQEPRKRAGCELFVGDDILLAANRNDVGLDRIQAYRGALPPRHGIPYRRQETMIGLRVVMPPEPADASVE